MRVVVCSVRVVVCSVRVMVCSVRVVVCSVRVVGVVCVLWFVVCVLWCVVCVLWCVVCVCSITSDVVPIYSHGPRFVHTHYEYNCVSCVIDLKMEYFYIQYADEYE